MLGILLAALDQTIVSTAIRTIADDLHGLNLQAWATTAYLITATISTPLYGKLSDLYGRKPLLLTAISTFIVGSVLCTISTSMYELAVFRAVQGLGAGGLISLAFAIIGDILPPRERARYQGYFLAVFGTASVIGPLAGGAFAGANSILGLAGWRWVFLVNVPIAAAALIVVTRALNLPHNPREHRIDWAGALALTAGVVPVMLVAEQGRDWGWDSAPAILCYVIAGAGLSGFVVAERQIGDEALLPLRLFRNSVFRMTSATSMIIGTGMFGGLALIPLYLQIVKGASPTKAGLLLLPLVAGIMIASVLSGQFTSRTGRYKIFPVLGTALMAVSLGLLHFRLGVDTSFVEVDVYMALFGLGLGGCLQTLIMAAQNSVPARDMGVATASVTFFRQMGGTLGVAVFLSVLFSTVENKIIEAFRVTVTTPAFQTALADPAVRANPANDVVLRAIRTGGANASANTSDVLQDSSFLQHIDPRLARPFLVGFSNAMNGVFILAAVMMILACVLMLFMEELPLRQQSGIEALAGELGGDPQGTLSHAPAAVPPPPVAATEPNTAQQRGLLIYGQVTDSGHKAVAGATVTLADLSGRQLDRTYSDDKGDYRLAPPTGGNYLVLCASTVYQPAIALVSVAELPLRHDVLLSGGNRRLSGTVRNIESRQAMPDLAVSLIDFRGDVVVTAMTGSDGQFTVPDVSPGLYTLTVAGTTVQPVARNVDLRGPADVICDIEVVARTELSGVVRSASSGAPIHDALTILLNPDGQVVASVITDSDGTFRFDDLQPGTYTLVATGYPPVATQVQLGVGTHAKTVITLAPVTVANGAAGHSGVNSTLHWQAAEGDRY
ncbi:MAG: MFS transporter [Pseudonocardiales bacterium]|nr:MFS transporter [Pseudonocardiales bacterium]